MATRLRTERSRRAYLTVCGRELDLDHLICPVVNGWSPTAAGVAFRAHCLLVLPIDEKVVGIEACLLTGLPLMVPAGCVNTKISWLMATSVTGGEVKERD